MKPYACTIGADGTMVQIYHGDALEVMEDLGLCAQVVITDVPYLAATTRGARSGSTKGGARQGHRKLITSFKPWDARRLHEAFRLMGQASAGWVVSFADYATVDALERFPPWGLRFVRRGVWVKRGAAPQFTGDRPGMGWEAVAVLHRDIPGRMKWNGGGKHAVWTAPVVRKGHPTQKPELVLSDMVLDFSHPGDMVLDPFAGTGSTLLAARRFGRNAIGIELDERWCEHAAKALEAPYEPATGRRSQGA